MEEEHFFSGTEEPYPEIDDPPLEPVYVIDWLLGAVKLGRIAYGGIRGLWTARAAASAAPTALAAATRNSFVHGRKFIYYLKTRFGNIFVRGDVVIKELKDGGRELILGEMLFNYGENSFSGGSQMTYVPKNGIGPRRLLQMLKKEIPDLARAHGFKRLTYRWTRTLDAAGSSTNPGKHFVKSMDL